MFFSRHRGLICLVLMLAVLCIGIPALAAETGYTGPAKCAECHQDISASFTLSIHGKTGYWESGFLGCEACHGPGENHASAGGDKAGILGPASWTPNEISAKCLDCHNKTMHIKYWKGSIHQRRGLGCTDCHNIHAKGSGTCGPKLLKAATEMEVCLCCHADLKITLMQRSRHPMRDSSRKDLAGNMTCSDCHNVHGTVADKLVDANSINDKCYECHMEKKSPVVWEHSPVKENCMTCHKPHGSNQQNLLVEKVPRLCQSCHFQGRHQTVAGNGNYVWAINRGCLNCHPMVHGSNNPSAVKLDR